MPSIEKLEQFFIRKYPWPESVVQTGIYVESDGKWTDPAPRLKDDTLIIDEGDWIVTYSDGSLQVVKCDSFEKFINDVVKQVISAST